MHFAYALCMRRQNLVPLSCLYAEPFTLVIEIVSNYYTTPPRHKLQIFRSRAGALSASIMLLYCSSASSSFAPRKSSFLSDKCLNSRMYTTMVFGSFLITMPSGLRFQKQFSFEIISFTEMFFWQFLLPSSSAIACCISAETISLAATCQRVHTPLFIRCNKPELFKLLVGVCVACILAYRCLQMKWCAAVTVVLIASHKALLMCPYVSFDKLSVLATRCLLLFFAIK